MITGVPSSARTLAFGRQSAIDTSAIDRRCGVVGPAPAQDGDATNLDDTVAEAPWAAGSGWHRCKVPLTLVMHNANRAVIRSWSQSRPGEPSNRTEYRQQVRSWR